MKNIFLPQLLVGVFAKNFSQNLSTIDGKKGFCAFT
jgi:hypothetical protein